MPPWLRLPATGSPEARTATWVSVPPAAVTVMPAAGSASWAPFAGVIVTRGPAAAPALAPDVPPAWAAGLAWPVPCPPPVHPVASRASAATTARPVIFRTDLTSAHVPRSGMPYTRA